MTEPTTPYDEEQLERYRKLLSEKRQEIAETIQPLREEKQQEGADTPSAELSGMPTHHGDAGTRDFRKGMQQKLLENEETRLVEVDRALERIENGTFGACQECGKPIGEQRLEAKPWARYCIDDAPEEPIP